MPTDTQRAPTLSQCIEREREAVSRYFDAELCTPDEVEKLQAIRAARSEPSGEGGNGV